MKLNVLFSNLIKKIYLIFTKSDPSIKALEAGNNDIDDQKIKDMESNSDKLNQSNNFDKEAFFQMYNEAKQDDFDVFSVNEETLSKICDMMEEELKLKKRILEEKRIELKKISS